MKYRTLIAKQTGWCDALAFAEKRNAAAPAA